MRRKYNSLGEPLEVVMQKMIQSNLVKLLDQMNYEESQFKPAWYNEINVNFTKSRVIRQTTT